MKVITFLGTGKYEETTYLHPHGGKSAKPSPLFQEALLDFYSPQEMLVLLTPTAAAHSNWNTMQTRL
ncbi:hypothetical protein IQE94_17860 (plasmid) [Synechocystis sp. PCC 7339]|uniref:TM1812 family CRISPR-associated protein n=1 Tax=unclassified Synechocystis TaxID=2640012 RepID=UPI001BAED60B|nr:hypothetical protein HTZ78_17560 [Synechocystis sp. PCC 7338]UAJ74654.1 hypothetical protein IQE94_17860 [Synechocystis sp. PCC 7339]